jgi:hypothetical protein
MTETTIASETSAPEVRSEGRYSKLEKPTRGLPAIPETGTTTRESSCGRIVVHGVKGTVIVSYNSDEAKSRAVREEIDRILKD